MRSLEWNQSHAAFVTEIDDEHQEIFKALSELREALDAGCPVEQLRQVSRHLAACTVAHFAHEERLMRAARYHARDWHKQQHDHVRTRLAQLAPRVEHGDAEAGTELAEYLTAWLHDHTRLTDRMLGAFLRNHRRGLCKLKFRAGTKPADACNWVRVSGERFDPAG